VPVAQGPRATLVVRVWDRVLPTDSGQAKILGQLYFKNLHDDEVDDAWVIYNPSHRQRGFHFHTKEIHTQKHGYIININI